MSGIGKAVMYLYKNPREISANRTIAGKLISRWRPLSACTTVFLSSSHLWCCDVVVRLFLFESSEVNRETVVVRMGRVHKLSQFYFQTNATSF